MSRCFLLMHAPLFSYPEHGRWTVDWILSEWVCSADKSITRYLSRITIQLRSRAIMPLANLQLRQSRARAREYTRAICLRRICLPRNRLHLLIVGTLIDRAISMSVTHHISIRRSTPLASGFYCNDILPSTKYDFNNRRLLK